MTQFIKTFALVAALGALSLPADAQGKSQAAKGRSGVDAKDKGRGKDHDRAKDRNDDIRVIRSYFSSTAGLPPGLAKRDRLPPGLEKQLVRNHALPPGLAKRQVAVPFELERRLTILPVGYQRVIVGDNIVVVDQKRSIIADIIGIIAGAL